MPPKVKLLTGCPRESELDWPEQGLLSNLLFPFEGFIARQTGYQVPSTPAPQSSLPKAWPNWRSIALDNNSQVSRNIAQDTNADSLLLPIGSTPQQSEDFLEQSFANYDNSNAPQFRLYNSNIQDNSLLESHHSVETTSSSFLSSTNPASSQEPQEQAASIINFPSAFSNMKDLPCAGYVESIQPQTITVDIIVGVINVEPPRAISLRQSNRVMDIVELLVGDESKSGFPVTFWLQPFPNNQDALRKPLASLRPRDIVLMRSVALHVWQGRVYGQSLSRARVRTETKVEILGRDGEVDIAFDSQSLTKEVAKVKRVADWIVSFVGAHSRGRVGVADEIEERDKTELISEMLPPETQ